MHGIVFCLRLATLHIIRDYISSPRLLGTAKCDLERHKNFERICSEILRIFKSDVI